METYDEPFHREVIRQATQCATVYGMHDTRETPTSVVDMATTGEIPEGYTHLIYVVINGIGYVVSRNREGQYKVEIHKHISSQGKEGCKGDKQ